MRKKVYLELVRQLIANYMWSEGCSCCEDTEAHKEHEKALAELLNVPMYEDGSGYDFYQYRSDDLKDAS